MPQIDDAQGGSRIRSILARANSGDTDAWDEFFALVFEEWHALARAKMRRESPAHTLETSALVNEAWLRLQQDGKLDFENTRHLHGAIDQAMNRVLVDHARKKGSLKRGGEHARVELEDAEGEATPDGIDLDLAAALEEFQRIDGRAASVALFRYAYGYDNAEVATILQVSDRTVREDWRVARAWLRRRLS